MCHGSIEARPIAGKLRQDSKFKASEGNLVVHRSAGGVVSLVVKTQGFVTVLGEFFQKYGLGLLALLWAMVS